MRRSARGFTLLEVMLAVTILGIVVVTITATWNAGLNGWKRTAGISESFQRERIVMNTLADLTKSIVYAKSDDGLYDVLFESEEGASPVLSFVTASDAALPKSEALLAGMRRVSLSLQSDARGRPYLSIANAPALTAEEGPEAAPHVLSAEVCGFAVRFRSAEDGSWTEEWTDGELPSAIEYTVAFGANDGRTPPVVVTRSVELPVAQYALQLAGMAYSQTDTTNTVNRREVELTPPTGGGGGGGGTGSTDTESDDE